MFSQHIVTAQKKLSVGQNAALMQRADGAKALGRTAKQFVPFNQSQLSRTSGGFAGPEDSSALAQKVSMLENRLNQSPKDTDTKAQIQQLLAFQQQQTQKIGALMATIESMKKEQEELKQSITERSFQEVQNVSIQKKTPPSVKTALPEHVEEVRELPNLVQNSPQFRASASPQFPSVELLIQTNAAFGSCLSKQLKLLNSSTPAIVCYNYFYNLAYKFQQLLQSRDFYEFARKTLGGLREFNNTQSAVEDAKAAVKSRFDLNLMLILTQYCFETVQVDLNFMDQFQSAGKFQDLFKEMFGDQVFNQKIRVKGRDHIVSKPGVIFGMLAIVVLQMGCQVIKYDTIIGTLREFSEVYGAQMGDGADPQQQAYVLLPQWFGDDVQVPAYVRLQKTK